MSKMIKIPFDFEKYRAACIFPVILNEMNRKPPTSKPEHVHPFNLCALHTNINVIIFIALEKKKKQRKKKEIVLEHTLPLPGTLST